MERAARRLAPIRVEHQRPARQAAAIPRQGGPIAATDEATTRTSDQAGRTRSRPATCSRSPAARRRRRPPGGLRDGLRNPFRVQVDENDVAYVSDTHRNRRCRSSSAARPGTDRYEIVRHPADYGSPIVTGPTFRTTAGTSTVRLRSMRRRRRSAARARASRTTRIGTSRAVRPSSRDARRCRRSPTRTSGTRTATTTRLLRSARPASATTGRTR